MTLAELRVREAGWRANVRRWRRRERSQRAKTMDLQRRFHAGEAGVTHAQVDAAKQELNVVRAGLAEAEAALAKVRADIAALSAPKLLTAAQVGLSGFKYLWGAKGAVTRGAGHYTAGGRASNAAELAAEMRSDHAYHMNVKGWGGLAYEAMVADDGTIGFGNPMDRKSAAVDSTNTGMVSICCPGTRGDRMTAAQKRSVQWLLDNWHTSKVPKVHRLPRPAREFGWLGHKEYPGQLTECPDKMLLDYRNLWK
jgi:hypothetical protein